MQVHPKKATNATVVSTEPVLDPPLGATNNGSRQFRMGAHNVPSGPNPESNR